MKKALTILFSGAILLASAGTIFASGDSVCQVVYGGGEVCKDNVKFTINKLVQAQDTKGGGSYVENLTANDPRLKPGQNINFKIVIENTGDKDIENLHITDKFPQYLTFVAGVGNTNAGASEVKFVVGKLASGKKVEYTITAKAADEAKLPNDKAITCVTNTVKGVSPDGSQASDDSQICIEKQVLGATPAPTIYDKQPVGKVPATGPEMAYIVGLFPLGAAGVYLRRKFN